MICNEMSIRKKATMGNKGKFWLLSDYSYT